MLEDRVQQFVGSFVRVFALVSSASENVCVCVCTQLDAPGVLAQVNISAVSHNSEFD